MEYIEKLTKKQEASMKGYADKWIKIGLKTGKTDWKTFDKYMPICYQKAGLVYPKNIVRVSSPLVGGLASSIAEGILRKCVGDAVHDAIDDAVDGAVGDAVDDAVGDAVRGAVGDAVRGAVDGAVGDAVGGAVDGAVGDAVDDAVGGAVDGAVGDAVDDAVGGAVDGAVDGAVGNAVRGAVGGAVGDAVRGAVDGAVGDAVRGAVGDAVLIIKKLGLVVSWHYWLGGQFWVGYSWYWGIAFVNFFFDICKLKLSKDIMERAFAYRKVCESVNYIWPNRDFVMVCARPTKINRDENGRLHSTTEKAIEYPDGWGLYMIHGVKFTEEQFKKSQKATVLEILSWEDIDQRSVLLQERPIEELFKNVSKKLIDKTKECGGYELYEIELEKIGKAKVISYKGWSLEKPYIKFVSPEETKALEAVAKLRHQTTEELINSIKS